MSARTTVNPKLVSRPTTQTPPGGAYSARATGYVRRSNFAALLQSAVQDARSAVLPMAPRAAQPARVGAAVPGGLAAVPNGYGALVAEAARRYGVDPALIAGVIDVESGFNARAVSGAGAKGLMQLMDGTARGLGVADSLDPEQNVMGGARFLRGMLDRYGGDARLALAAYNAGPGNVDRYGGVPPFAETQRYVPRVLAAAEKYRR